jgi:Uma2 family endonuclease
MVTSTPKMTYEEFLNFDDGTEYLYELENGELIQVASESELNQTISVFLLLYFARLGIYQDRLRVKSEIAVQSYTVGVRVPDLMIFSEELASAMRGAKRSLVTLDMPPPMLVVEVVSPDSEKRDYRYKRTEYAARGIPEYWIIDPIAEKVTILEWVEGMYEEKVFQSKDNIISPQLGTLSLTVNEILQAGECVN